MEVSIFPEAYINNLNNRSISNTNQVILCRKILDKYQDILIDNIDGCIFKISYTHPIIKSYFECYVSCIEFTAPDNSMFISNENFDKMCLSMEYKVNIHLFNPPQASLIIFTIKDTTIDNIEDIKSNLESVLNSKYKFLQKGQKIPFLDDNLIVKDIEHYEICLINNTNLVVEFDIIKTIEKVDESNSLDSIINVIETQDEPEYPILSQEELRKKRLDYFLKNS